MNLFMIRTLVLGGLTVAAAGVASPAIGAGLPGPTPVSPQAGAKAGPAPGGGPFAACAVGNCEVTVKAGDMIPVPAGTGVKSLKVTEVGGGNVRIDGNDVGGGHTVLCLSYCNVSATNGEFAMELGPHGEAYENRLHITLVSQNADSAVIRLAQAPDPSTALANILLHWLPGLVTGQSKN